MDPTGVVGTWKKIRGKNLIFCFVVAPPQRKPGRCPVVRLQIACPRIRVRNECTNDYACPGDQKCCNTGCRRSCVDVQGKKT